MSSSLVVERDVNVEARDGIRLSTDVYRNDDGQRRPVLVQRTPYSKSNAWFVGGLLFNPLDAVQRGYNVVVQDCRGRFGSEGEWEPFVHESEDGYDTIEWAAAQPWSNGRVGVYGSSYMGVASLQALASGAPHLAAALGYVTGSRYSDSWIWTNGVFELGFSLHWTTGFCRDTGGRVKDNGERAEVLGDLGRLVADLKTAAASLPLTDLAPFDRVAPYWKTWLEHPVSDAWWKRTDVIARIGQVQAPLLQIAGWYDNFLPSQIALHRALTDAGGELASRHRLVVGPWDHEAYLSMRTSSAGERDFGPSAASGPGGVGELALSWFDAHLRGKEIDMPPVRWFVMGTDAWTDGTQWPPVGDEQRLYLHSGGDATSADGNGWLSTDAPGNEPADSYRYDPWDPVPSHGGPTLHPPLGDSGVYDQQQIENRPDVLCYTSIPLETRLTITGSVTAVLHVASSAEDTDFTVKLVDVAPHGYAANVTEGVCRARWRMGDGAEHFLTPGDPAEIRINLPDTAYGFRAGHRIRLEVSSSNFPRFSRNANSRVQPELATRADLLVADQQVFHDAGHPSALLLPVAAERQTWVNRRDGSNPELP